MTDTLTDSGNMELLELFTLVSFGKKMAGSLGYFLCSVLTPSYTYVDISWIRWWRRSASWMVTMQLILWTIYTNSFNIFHISKNLARTIFRIIIAN